MSEENTTTQSATSEAIDYSGRPFGYLSPDKDTAMICVQDKTTCDILSKALIDLDYDVVTPTTFKEALRYMRFHIFDIIIVDENFDTDVWDANYVLTYIEYSIMPVRRQTFVVLLSELYPTMDNMRAFNKSVNLILNKKEASEAGIILKKELSDNKDFYFLFKETIRKFGKF
ncbi:MAG TPA: response regulator [Deltaproteobacteria bacterium]|nr:response regulator [Deltaproteobacteria bacterium]